MRSFRAPKWLLLAVLLALTLGWKMLARSIVAAPPTARDIQATVADFLLRQHFSVSVSEHPEQGKPSVTASSGACRMLVAESPALGWDRDLIRRYAESDDHVFVVFRGHIYANQPTVSTAFDALWSRVQWQLGGGGEPHPVLAVIAKPTCMAESLPWGEIAAEH